MTLSNRQRRAQRKVTPKPARKAKPAVAIVRSADEAQGVAATQAVRDQVKARLMRQGGLDLAVSVALGHVTEAQAKRQFGVETFAVDGVVVFDGRSRTVRPAVALRVKGDDGIAALHGTGSLSDDLAKAALAYRICYETAGRGLGSGLGSAGEGRRVRDWSEVKIVPDPEAEMGLALACSAMELHRAYVMARLNQLEREVGLAMVDGRELVALQEIAGAGRSVRDVAQGGGRKATVYRDALIRALVVVARVLRITER